jgi:hypothetical protein
MIVSEKTLRVEMNFGAGMALRGKRLDPLGGVSLHWRARRHHSDPHAPALSV